MKRYYNGKPSDHFDGVSFFDLVANQKVSFKDLLKWQIGRQKSFWPKNIPLLKTDHPPERVYGSKLRVSNIGHATFLIQTEGLNLLTDPVWSKRASPFSFAGPKRVIDPGIAFANLPPIDLVWISHNHYDHLDLRTVNMLWKVHKPKIITPLGNDTIIQSTNRHIHVKTLDWGQSLEISKNIHFYLTPSQHWSARGIFDRNRALWGALTMTTPSGNLYFVGDSGYGDGRYFKKDKETFGSFRLAILPMGAYEPRWMMKYAHMNPEEMVKAYYDLGRPITIPSHYDVFKLTDEGFGEAKSALQKAIEKTASKERIHVLDIGKSLFL